MMHAIGATQPRNLILGWRGVLALAALLIGVIWGLGLVQDILRFASGSGAESVVWILDADSEEGLLTWVSIVLLFTVAALLFANGQKALLDGGEAVMPWFALAVLFGIASFDEFHGLHERFSGFLSQNVGGAGLFHFVWVVPFGLLAAFGLWLLMPFLHSLGRRTCSLALASAVVYLAGAVGMEMIGGMVFEEHGNQVFVYRMLTNLEEGLEVAGILLFIYTLQRHRYAEADA